MTHKLNATKVRTPQLVEQSVFREYSTCGRDFLQFFPIDLRIAQVKFFQRLANRRRNPQMCKTFVARRNDIPRSLFTGGVADHVFVSFLIIVPRLTLLNISCGEFPMFLRFVEPRLEPPLLP